MKLFVVLCVLMAVAACAPTVDPELAAKRLLPALIIEETRDEFGQFTLRYLTADGTIVSERGRLVPTEDDGKYVLITEGEFTYIGGDGKPYVTKFAADLDGTRIEDDHLPFAPKHK